MKDTLIVIPVYNEAHTLKQVALNTKKVSSSFADILFINDFSTDGSMDIIDELKKDYPDIQCINRVKNKGYGAAMIDGFNFAINYDYKYVITMDCDEQHDPEDLHLFCNESPEIDVVSGSRYMPESKSVGINAPEDRVAINNRITNKLNQAYNFKLTDSFCGFKRYSTEKLKGHNFEEMGYAFPMEFWAFAAKNDFTIKEIPVNRIYVTDDRSFGNDLDNCGRRYRYYLKVWKKACISISIKTPD